MEKMTKCKVCGNPVAKDAKICPHCGKKLNHPVFNTMLTIITIIIVINFFRENIDLKGTTAYTAEELQSTVETDYKQTSNKIIEERSHTTLEEENIIDVTVDELNTLLEENALKASRTYKNKKVRLTGILRTIDSSGRYFSLGPLRGMSIFGNVTCEIEERHLDTVIDLVKGQKLTVEGKIITVGEVIGYTIEVEEVQKTKEESKDYREETTENKAIIVNNAQPMSKTIMNETIKEDGYTQTESENRVNNSNINWNEQATRSAAQYIEYLPFSRSGLIEILEQEGFTYEQATYGVEQIEIDWNEQATRSAAQYIEYLPFSRSGLIEILEQEGFTYEQATYGVEQIQTDWNEQAIKSAELYYEYMPTSRKELIEMLEQEGYTPEQAIYGVENISTTQD